jgi:hypothetical protein
VLVVLVLVVLVLATARAAGPRLLPGLRRTGAVAVAVAVAVAAAAAAAAALLPLLLERVELVQPAGR